MDTAPFSMGRYLVFPGLNRIQAGDRVVTIEPKMMRALVCLAEHAPNPVTKDELRVFIWGGYEVSESVLKHLIWDLRKCLGDKARTPEFIETVPRVGYRLIAVPGEPSPPGPESSDQAESPTVEHTGPRASDSKIRFKWQAPLFLAVAVLLVWWWRPAPAPSPSQEVAPNPVRYAVTPFTSSPGLEIDPAFSPDGKRIAFAWRPNMHAEYDLYLRDLASSEPVRMTRAPGDDLAPAWSPDGRMIAFIRAGAGAEETGLFMYELATGDISRVDTGDRHLIQSVDWSPDGESLVFAFQVEGRFHLGLWNRTKGDIQLPVAPSERGLGDRDPIFSPEGDRLAFLRTWSPWSGDLFLYHVSTRELTRLTFDHAGIVGLTWDSDGGLVFSSDRTPPRALWRVDPDRASVQWLPVPAKHPHKPDAHDAGGFVFQEVSCDPNIMSLNLADGVLTQDPSNLASTRLEYHPRYDGKGVGLAFISDRTGATEIWLQATANGTPRRVTHLHGPFIASFSWSPSDSEIVFDTHEDGRAALRIVSTEAGEIRSLHADNHLVVAPFWASNGWIYFGSNRSGDWQIWRKHPETDELEPVTTQGGFRCVEGVRDGRLYFHKRDDRGIWSMPLAGGPASCVVADLDPVNGMDWIPGHEGIYYVRDRGRRGLELAFHEFSKTQVTRTYPIFMLSPYPGLSLSPDGSRILIGRVEAYQSDLILARRATD
ncbi:PD40 domain-containing protein [Sulfidibacter corallicola]|uniref:PD40 domain-containing protein n=1 Tax=Sulfidibacter corallicola TaxID=2818388 RepID=A0A8A4TGY8_SULCO|nr:winged helix-turn-helix domain-containing protein [Sulfidibacter corallicola]QTD48474.1 PD40 domain-containing protein [Sulfidibacter corallicola]